MVFVPKHRTFHLSPHTEINKYYKGALYRFPVAGINGCTLIVPVALGIASNALNELKLLTEKIPSGSTAALKEKGSFQRKLGMAEALVRSARTYLHQALTDDNAVCIQIFAEICRTSNLFFNLQVSADCDPVPGINGNDCHNDLCDLVRTEKSACFFISGIAQAVLVNECNFFCHC